MRSPPARRSRWSITIDVLAPRRGFYITHSDAPHSVGLLWTSGQPRRRDRYLTTHNRQTFMLPVGFEPTISAGERPLSYALDRTVTGTGIIKWRSGMDWLQRFPVKRNTMRWKYWQASTSPQGPHSRNLVHTRGSVIRWLPGVVTSCTFILSAWISGGCPN
jgi:hypothetical protein